MAFITCIVLSILALTGIGAAAIWLGARWMHAGRTRFGAALVAAVLILLCNLFLLTVKMAWDDAHPPNTHLEFDTRIARSVLLAIVGLVGSIVIIKVAMKTSLAKAAFAWLLHGVAGLGFAVLVVRPFLLESYVIPAASMAPTLMGWHHTAVCPRCQQTLRVPHRTRALPGDDKRLTVAICDNYHSFDYYQLNGMEIEESWQPQDRLMADKTSMPGRWQLAVFKYPDDPTETYVKRVVGLPGEEVWIDDGAVWINGQRQTPPGELRDLEYLSGQTIAGSEVYGRKDAPLLLGPNEYFMLGDLSRMSSDSRFWGPVPRDAIIGVGALRYWPPSRWKVLD